jgi:hypothetical protein
MLAIADLRTLLQ